MIDGKKKLVLLGGGGHCVSVIDVIEQEKKYDIIGILDPNSNHNLLGYQVLGGDEMIPKLVKENVSFLICVGQIKSVALRMKLARKLSENKANMATVISPLCYVSKHALIEEGTIIMHHALVNAGAKVGKHCIINTKANIEHGAEIGDFCHISTAAVVNGDTKVGKETFVGSNAVLSNNIEVQPNSIISAGMFVT